VIKTLNYGVRPSGNQTAAGFGKIADHCLEKYPEKANGAIALKKNTYVDDVVRSDKDNETSKRTAEDLDFTLKLANISVKSYTFNGQKPGDDVSADGEHVSVVGLQWAPEEDLLSLDVKPLYFGKCKRGKLPSLVDGPVLPALKDNFTRRNMLAKTASVFDPLGLCTPVTAKFKLDLHGLIEPQLQWDDKIPDEHREDWLKNVNDMQRLREIKFRRTVIPENAASCDVELIVSSDASQSIAIACVHARVKLVDGSYSCQLVSAKSKLVKELTIPKAELRGLVLATHLAHSVKYSLQDQHRSTLYVSDSSICLFWLSQDERPLETMVRNAVIEIRRFCSPQQWFHVKSEDNLADLGTRLAEIEDIDRHSEWQEGKYWMKLGRDEMPLKSVEELKLSGEERKIAYSETRPIDIQGIQLIQLRDKVSERYKMNQYLVDPNRYGWGRACRVTAMIIKAVRKLRKKFGYPDFSPEWFPPSQGIQDRTVLWVRGKPALSSHELRIGEHYYYRRSTIETLKCAPKKDLKDTDLRGKILYYTGRILHGQDVDAPENSMFDIDHLCFVRPVVDRYSPVAYSIMVHAHTEVVNHRSAVATLRSSRDIVYILRGRDLANEVRESCKFCTRYKRKLLAPEIGPVHPNRLTVAPAFYLSQVDIFGPLDARCEHNHRSSIKVYGLVFKCTVSCAVAIYSMTNYSTDSFISAYTRFASRYGHPTRLYIDRGTQLVKGCESMEFSITDAANILSKQYKVGIEYEACAVQGHQAQGMVERAIRTIKDLLYKVYNGIKMDSFAYETAFAWISAQLNNLPIGLGSRTDNLDHLDLITPARLILGRASNRALDGHVRISPPSRVIEQMDTVFRSWFETWKREKIADYIPKPPHWREGNADAKVGDIVLMLCSDKEKKLGAGIWRMGRISKLSTSADGVSRVATIEYRNPEEKTFRETVRSLRAVAVVHRETELDIIQQLNGAARDANTVYYLDKR
jgi:hypothetical protein